MLATRLNTCHNCLHWQMADKDYGWCHKHAPSPMKEAAKWNWPRTAVDDWCGEFDRKANIPHVTNLSRHD